MKQPWLYGPNLLLWRSSILLKAAGTVEGGRIPWHQDGAYFKLIPEANISFWLALDEATEENGCMQVLPGTHTTIFPSLSGAQSNCRRDAPPAALTLAGSNGSET